MIHLLRKQTATTLPDWEVLQNMADHEKLDYIQAVLAAFSHLTDIPTGQQIRQAIGRGDIAGAINLLDWETFESELMQATEQMAMTLQQQAAQFALTVMVPAVVTGVTSAGITSGTSWFVLDQKMLAYAQQHAAELVVEISQETRLAIRDVMQRALIDGLTVTEQQFIFRETVGLTSQLANALYNYEKTLREAGTDPATIRALVADKKEQYLNYRAEMIARTETITTTNAGVYEGIEQGVRDGFINANEYGIEWIVTPDDRLCKYCRPLQGKVVRIGQLFNTLLGPAKHGALHPNCRCTIALAPLQEQLTISFI